MADSVTISETSYIVQVTPSVPDNVTISEDVTNITITEVLGDTVTVTTPAAQQVTIASSASLSLQTLAGFTTDDLAEGSNLYYTDARASAAAPVQDITMPLGYTVTNSLGDFTISVSNATQIRQDIGADNAANLTTGDIPAGRLSNRSISDLSDVGILDKTADNIMYTDGTRVLARQPSNWSLTDFTNDLTSGDLPAHTHDAADITSGIFSILRIPDLSTSKITSGTFADARISSSSVTQHAGDIDLLDLGNVSGTIYGSGSGIYYDGANWVAGPLTATQIPSLDTSKITTGTFADARISESSVTQHEAALAIAASQLTSGSLSIDLNPSADLTYNIGTEDFRWLDIHGDLDGAVTFRAKNDSGVTLTVGDIVYINGVSGSTPTVALADCSDPAKMPAFGMVRDVSVNPNAETHIVTLGSVEGVDVPSGTYTLGTNVYVGTAGTFTDSPPTGEGNLIQNIGLVARVNPGGGPAGIIKVGGAGRTNAVPNLNQDKVFLGNPSNQAVSTALSSINLSSFNNDLTLGANDYISQPTYTNNQVKLWYDFLNAVPDRLNYTIWWLNNGGSGVIPEESTIAGSRGGVSLLLNANNDRHTFWGPSVLTGPQEADGDEIVWESRCYFTDSLATAGYINLGLADQVATLNSNDQPPGTGYSGFDQVGLSIDLSQTYLQWFVKDTGAAGSPTVADLTSYPISSYVDTWFRFGIHAKYNATNLNWDITLYVNGTSVATTTMTFDSILTPYVGGGVGTSAGTCVVDIDWISCQYKIGGILAGRTDHVSLEDI